MFFLFLYIKKEKYPKRKMRSRIVGALTNFHAKEFSRLSASSHASFRDGRGSRLFYTNEASRERTRRRVGLRFSLPGPFDQHTLSRSAKNFFFYPVRCDARTRAHAPSTKTTHRRREFTRTGKPPPRLKILRRRAC